MDGGCLFTPGVAEVLFAAVGDPHDRKSLSAASKAARRAYRAAYFPRGRLLPRKVTVGLGLRPACPCGRRPLSSGTFQSFMGMTSETSLGMTFHCGRAACREALVRASYARASRALLRDAGRGYSVPPQSFSDCFSKVAASSMAYCKLRCAHDSIVSCMLKMALSGCPDPDPEGFAWGLGFRESEALAAYDLDEKKVGEISDTYATTIYVSFNSSAPLEAISDTSVGFQAS